MNHLACDILMALIDGWIRMDMESEKLSAPDRLEYMLQFKELMISEFVQFKQDEPQYYKIITTEKYGPYAPWAYDRYIKTSDGSLRRERPDGHELPNLSDL